MPISVLIEPLKITCLYDMDIPRPDNFNETYLYEGTSTTRIQRASVLTLRRTYGM